jgi:hypothetical protein
MFSSPLMVRLAHRSVFTGAGAKPGACSYTQWSPDWGVRASLCVLFVCCSSMMSAITLRFQSAEERGVQQLTDVQCIRGPQFTTTRSRGLRAPPVHSTEWP